MGKFPNSDIHGKYSDWHWELVKQNPKYRRLYVGDIDRLWLEYNFSREAVIAAFDIKWDGSEDAGLTATTKGIYEWLEKKGCQVFTVFITRDFQLFKVVDQSGKKLHMTSTEYADWLLSLRAQTPIGGII